MGVRHGGRGVQFQDFRLCMEIMFDRSVFMPYKSAPRSLTRAWMAWLRTKIQKGFTIGRCGVAWHAAVDAVIFVEVVIIFVETALCLGVFDEPFGPPLRENRAWFHVCFVF